MRYTKSILVLAGVLAIPAFTADPPFEIVRAQYGARNNWADVTNRVLSMSRSGYLDFRVGNDTLGIDPSRGDEKWLRVDVRDSRGRRETISVREGDRISLQVGGWDRGGWGNDRWGRNDGRWGRDDDWDRGRNRGRWGRDDDWNRDRRGRDGWGNNDQWGYRGGVQIQRATYGWGGRYMDVTNQLRQMLRGGSYSIKAGNDTFGSDPAPGREKELLVTYTYNGQRRQARVEEGDYLRIP